MLPRILHMNYTTIMTSEQRNEKHFTELQVVRKESVVEDPQPIKANEITADHRVQDIATNDDNPAGTPQRESLHDSIPSIVSNGKYTFPRISDQTSPENMTIRDHKPTLANEPTAQRPNGCNPLRRCNTTCCCSGGCVGLILFLLIFIVLAYFAPSIVGNLGDLVLNTTSKIPPVEKQEGADLAPDLEIFKNSDPTITFEISETRLNTFLRYEQKKLTVADIEKDKLTLYYKFDEIAPYSTIIIHADSNDTPNVTVHFGPIDITKRVHSLFPDFFVPIGENIYSNDNIDAEHLMEYLLFGETLQQTMGMEIQFEESSLNITLKKDS